MKLIEYCDEIKHTQDDFIVVTLKNDTQFSEKYAQLIQQFAGMVFINIRNTKYNENQNVLAYDIKGFVPLKAFLMKHVFLENEISKICYQAASLVLKMKKAHLSPANLIWDPDYIYVNDITYDVRFIFLPIVTAIDPERANLLLRNLIKRILFDMSTQKYFVIQGKILSMVNHAESFDPSRFISELESVNKENTTVKKAAHGGWSMQSVILSILTSDIAALIIFYISKNSSIKMLRQNGAFALVALLVSIPLLLFSRKKGKQKKAQTLKKRRKVAAVPKPVNRNGTEDSSPYKEIDLIRNAPVESENTTIIQETEKEAKSDFHESEVKSESRSGTQTLFQSPSSGSFLVADNNKVRINIPVFPFVIGTGKKVNLRLNDDNAEKEYALIDCVDGDFVLICLDTHYKITVNNIAIKEKTPFTLNNSDQIKIQNNIYKFFKN